MTELQKKLLKLLCEIDDICRKHEIEYCLFAGSGLGADRHQGFIPWDDDADIIMTLDNYERFLEVFDHEVKEGRVLNCLEKTNEYPFTYARYVDVTTTAVQRHTAFGGCDPGVKIDIFVVVPTYSKIEKAEKHRLEILAFSEIICPYAVMHMQRPEGFAEVYMAEKKLYDKLGREKYIKKRGRQLKYCKKPGTGKYVLFSGMVSNSYILDADILDEVVYVKYEDTELPVSKHNIKFSTQLYGDSWISKPQNIGSSQHTYLLDTDRPYTEYLDKLWEEIDKETSKQNAAYRKQLHMVERDGFRDVIINNQRLRNLAVEMNAFKKFESLSEEEKHDYKRVYDMFHDYYFTQLRGINKNYRLFINLKKDVFEAAVNAAVMIDRYYEAADIISIGISSGKLPEADEKLKNIIDRIDICRKVTEALYIKRDLNKCRQIIGEITDETVKNSLTVKIAELWIKAAFEGRQASADICDAVDALSYRYGEPGELLAIKGFCLEKEGKADEAAQVYETASENVRNGYMYQWLADKGYTTYEHKYD